MSPGAQPPQPARDFVVQPLTDHEKAVLKLGMLHLQYTDLQSRVRNVMSSVRPIGKSGVQVAVLTSILDDLAHKAAIPPPDLVD